MENHTNERGKNSGTGKLFHSLSFYQTVASLVFEIARLWCQFHFIRRCYPYKEIPEDPLFNLLLSYFSNSNKICMQRNLRNSVVLI